ncbi:membrane protein [Actinomadura oligospora]|uniref:membrane protein n=1 Tax=Actinomadura oligospora TaxID=111804 RepID=UPI00047B2EE2|nr:membrane protein [Actinomadura oligospora]
MTSSGDTRATLRHLFGHLFVPLLMCVGMGLAYLGAFHKPEPHDLRVAIVGSGPQTQILAQTLKDRAADALDVRTVPSRDAAVAQLKDQKIFGAYAPASPSPELLVASAGSDTTATVVQKVFTDVASAQHAPLKVTDVAPPAKGDPTAQGLFFLLVALSIGSYTSVAAIGGAGAPLRMRLRALIAVGTGVVVGAIGTLLAGPVFHLVDHDLPALFGMSVLYSTGILLIGVGLHTFLKRFTMLAMMVLFVMLNFTTAGGVFRPELQSGFFASLHSFWTGAGFVEGVRGLVYFDGHALGGHLLTLAFWLLAGVVLVGLAALHESRIRPALVPTREDLEQELEEAVPA